MPKDLEMAYRYDKDQIKEARGRGRVSVDLVLPSCMYAAQPHGIHGVSDLKDVGYMPCYMYAHSLPGAGAVCAPCH
jgi:hypothetical protein